MRIRPSLPAFALVLLLFLTPASPAHPQASEAAINAQSQSIAPPATPARITQAIDEKNLIALQGNVHPLARPEFDQGAVSDAMPMNRILLLLQRSPEQEQALQQLLEQQQSKSSPSYHAWLTPQQFGQQFGPADADIQTITQWLISQGFSQIQLGPGHGVIEFSGNAGQVRSAFHTEIHRFLQNGEEHTANIGDPEIPAALAPAVAGVVSLHNFPKKSHAKVLGQFRRTIGKPGLEPLFTFPNPFGGSGYFYGLGPGDFATIYNTKPLLVAGNDGTGQTIAIVGETNINVKDVQQFRSMFALSANFDATNIILNGADPGITSVDEEAEADLDVEWSGAVAPGATINLVVSASTSTSAGIDLSALYIIENNLAGVMSESYGACEKALGTTGNAFYNNLWEQAAAQGITVVVSSGDGGSAGCDNFNSPQPATQGLAVSGLASTPYNVSVGGTDFDQVTNLAAYWNPTNDPTGTSAKSYIPEIPWNENCAQIGLTGCGASAPQGSVNIVAGSGGPSSQYGKPKWQLGVAGMPSDNLRDQPDVSLFASAGFNGTAYIYCQSDRTISQFRGCDGYTFIGADFGLIGGTSASAPAFAGIMALVNQKQAVLSHSPRQGNANSVLYALAKQTGASCVSSTIEAAGCVFNDVSKGNSFLPTGHSGIATNSVPCQGGSLNCSVSVAGSNGVLVDPAHTTTEAWTATAGYDMTTGLGSVNVNNLVSSWSNASTIATTTTLTLSPTAGITHGSAENVSVSIAVTANTGTGVPTGDASLIATFPGLPQTTKGLDHFTLSGGSLNNATTQNLPGGTYNLTAHYSGDGTNAPSDSPAVQITVAPETSKLFANLVTFNVNGNPTNFTANSATYGLGYYLLRMDVGDSAATVSPSTGISSNCSKGISTCPTGAIAITANGAPLGSGSLPLNIKGFVENFSLVPGSYAISATYPGDASYGSSSTTANLTITKAPTTVTAGVAGLPVQYGDSDQIGAAVLTTSNGIAPTGTITFTLDGVPLATTSLSYEGFPYQPNTSPPSYANLNAVARATFTVSLGSHTLAAQYSGDANYAPGTSAPASFTVTQALPSFSTWGASPASVNIGQQTTLTAHMIGSDAGVAPTGTMTFYDGNAPIPGSVTYTPSGSAVQTTLPYTPTSVGTHSISVSYSGDVNYLPLTTSVGATLIVIGPDFTLTPQANTATVVAGNSAGYAIAVIGTNGFTGNVSVTCTVPAAATTCTANPASVAAGNNTTVTVTTTAHQAAPPTRSPRNFGPNQKFFPLLFLVMIVAAVLIYGSRTRRERAAILVPLGALILFFALQASSCSSSGSGGSSSGNGSPAPHGTQAGSYAVTVTATGSTAYGTVTHTTSLALVVQ